MKSHFLRASAGNQNQDNNIVFYDNFETFTDWVTYGSGVVSQSSDQAYSGTYSLKKSTNADPNGAYKLLDSPVTRNYTIEAWIFSPPRASSAADRIWIGDSSGNGYGFNRGSTTIGVERRNGGTGTNLTSNSNTRTNEVWYRVVFTANADNTFTVSVYNADGSLRISFTSISNSQFTGEFDRIYVSGGFDYFVDELKVTINE